MYQGITKDYILFIPLCNIKRPKIIRVLETDYQCTLEVIFIFYVEKLQGFLKCQIHQKTQLRFYLVNFCFHIE